MTNVLGIPLLPVPVPFGPRPDWFMITGPQAQSIGHSPGLQFVQKSGVWIAHRSQLPLLGTQSRAILRGPTGNGAGGQPTELPAEKTARSAPIFSDGQTVLRPYQLDDVAFMSDRRGILHAASMRTGKTGACIGTHDPDLGPMVVVAPLATRNVWRQWFQRRWPDEPIMFLTGRAYDRRRVEEANLFFVHYDVLNYWTSLGLRRRIGTLVFDEAHLLSKRKSKRTQTATLTATCAERIICATGTPLWNKPDGLFSILNVAAPASFGTYTEFTKRYCSGKHGAHGWKTGEASNHIEFRARIGEIMIQRRWMDLLDELAPTVRTLDKVEVPESILTELDAIAMALADQSPAARQSVIGNIARYRRLVGEFKAAPTLDLIYKQAADGRNVVWVWHQSVANTISRGLAGRLPFWVITGAVPEDKREEMLDEWRVSQNGVLVMSLSIGQAGIDLSAAHQCIFSELDWTPAVIGQAEMRTFAPTRENVVTYVACDHEVELRLVSILAEKCQRALLLGIPASDTAIDILGQIFTADGPIEADLSGLAERMIAQVRAQGGATFESWNE